MVFLLVLLVTATCTTKAVTFVTENEAGLEGTIATILKVQEPCCGTILQREFRAGHNP